MPECSGSAFPWSAAVGPPRLRSAVSFGERFERFALRLASSPSAVFLEMGAGVAGRLNDRSGWLRWAYGLGPEERVAALLPS